MVFNVKIINDKHKILATPTAITVYDNSLFSESLNFLEYFRENDVGRSAYFSTADVPNFVNQTMVNEIVTFDMNATSANIGKNYTIKLIANDLFEESFIDFVIEVLENEIPVSSSATMSINLYETLIGSQTIPCFTDNENDPITYSWVFKNTTDY